VYGAIVVGTKTYAKFSSPDVWGIDGIIFDSF
jgi:hypothetical protein